MIICILISPHVCSSGQRVYANGKLGVVRYMGLVHFEKGTWVGVETDAPGDFKLITV